MSERRYRNPETPIPRKIEVVSPKILREGDVKFLSERDYVCDIKYNGVHTVIVVDHGNIRIFTVGSDNFTRRNVSEHLPEIVEAVDPIAQVHSTAVIDSETISGEGKTSQERINVSSRINSSRPFDHKVNPVSLVPFDLLHLDGIDLRRADLLMRKEKLDELFTTEHRRQFGIKPAKTRRGNFMMFVYDTAAKGYEGLVFKRRDSLYVPQATRWLKYKYTKQELIHARENSST